METNQQLLLHLANTEAGKFLLKVPKGEKMVFVGKNCWHSYMGIKNGEYWFRAKYFFDDAFRRIIDTAIVKMDLGKEHINPAFFENKPDFYKMFLFYSELERSWGLRNGLPQLMLKEANFATFLGGAGRLDRRDEATWTAARDATDADIAFASQYEIQAEYAAPYYRIQRVFLPVTTGNDLPDNAKIKENNLEFNAQNEGGYTNSVIHYIQTTQANTGTLVVADYDQVIFTSGGSVTVTNASPVQAYKINGNETAKSWISLTGISKLGAISGKDLDNVAPTGAGNSQWITMQAPNVEVIYALPAGGFLTRFVQGGN